jgi:hypothetical protein
MKQPHLANWTEQMSPYCKVNAAYARREAARAESAAAEPEADDAGEEPAPQAPVQEPVKKERNWRSIFKRTLDKINEGFNAADDEEI